MAHYDIRHSITRIASTIFSVIVVVAMASPTSADGHAISGPAHVIDGRTMEIEGVRYTLYGIAVPDLEQTCAWPDKAIPCGDVARTALMDLVVASTVTCDVVDDTPLPDGYTPARCEIDGFDIGRNMVHTGWAVADRRTADVYTDTEEKARSAKRGLWKGTFTMPDGVL